MQRKLRSASSPTVLSICTVYRKLYNNVILYNKVIPLNRVECTSTTTNQIEVKMIALSYRERAEKLDQRWVLRTGPRYWDIAEFRDRAEALEQGWGIWDSAESLGQRWVLGTTPTDWNSAWVIGTPQFTKPLKLQKILSNSQKIAKYFCLWISLN